MTERTQTRNTETTDTTPVRDRRSRGPTTTDTDTKSESPTQSTCPECTGTIIEDSSEGQQVCSDCGLVVSEGNIDHGPEWRAFNSADRDKKSRVGAPTTKMMHDKGLSTNISWQDKDANGRSLSSRQREKMQRLRTWNERFRTRNSKERNLKQALGEIDRMASSLGLPKSVRETASVIYRQALKEDLLPGRSIEGVASAAVYASCRIKEMPRSVAEITHVSRLERKRILRTYRYINKELQLEVGPADPVKYLNRFISKIDSEDSAKKQETKRLSRHLIKKQKEHGLMSGKTPPGVTIGAIYTASKLCNLQVTQTELSAISNVTEVTMRQRYQDIITTGDEEWIHGPA